MLCQREYCQHGKSLLGAKRTESAASNGPRSYRERFPSNASAQPLRNSTTMSSYLRTRASLREGNKVAPCHGHNCRGRVNMRSADTPLAYPDLSSGGKVMRCRLTQGPTASPRFSESTTWIACLGFAAREHLRGDLAVGVQSCPRLTCILPRAVPGSWSTRQGPSPRSPFAAWPSESRSVPGAHSDPGSGSRPHAPDIGR